MLLGLRFLERNRVAERLDHIPSPPVLDIAIATLVYGFVRTSSVQFRKQSRRPQSVDSTC